MPVLQHEFVPDTQQQLTATPHHLLGAKSCCDTTFMYSRTFSS